MLAEGWERHCDQLDPKPDDSENDNEDCWAALCGQGDDMASDNDWRNSPPPTDEELEHMAVAHVLNGLCRLSAENQALVAREARKLAQNQLLAHQERVRSINAALLGVSTEAAE